MEKGWFTQTIDELEKELGEVLEELFDGDFALALGETEPKRSEMRELFDKLRFTDGATEEFINQQLNAGKTPEEIIGWLAKEANLAVRRDGRE